MSELHLWIPMSNKRSSTGQDTGLLKCLQQINGILLRPSQHLDMKNRQWEKKLFISNKKNRIMPFSIEVLKDEL